MELVNSKSGRKCFHYKVNGENIKIITRRQHLVDLQACGKLKSFDIDQINFSTKRKRSFSTVSFEGEPEDDVEILKHEADNIDPLYWEKLLGHHYEQTEEDDDWSLDKGKRFRKQANYGDGGEVGGRNGDGSWQENISDYNSDSVPGDDNTEEDDFVEKDDNDDPTGRNRQDIRRDIDREKDSPLPPLLARVGGNIEVLGFNARQRKSFLNAIMMYGMPPHDIFNSQWLVRDLKEKSENSFKAYASLFMRHLCEPDHENRETFADGVPMEGISRQHVLTRIGVMSLTRKKVQEFEDINGMHSMPHLIVKKKKGEGDKSLSSTPATGSPSTTPVSSAMDSPAPKEKEEGGEKAEENPIVEDIKKNGEKKAEKSEDMETDENKDAKEEEVKDDKKKENSTPEEGKDEEVKEDQKEDPKFMFSIADGGFTELHTLWQNEEKTDVPGREYEIWHR